MIDNWAIDDANLDVYQFRLLHHIARVGICFKSVRTLADDCNISVGKVSTTRQWLFDNGYIETAVHQESGKVGYKISDKFKRSPDEQNVHHMNGDGSKRSPHEQECSPDEQQCSPHEPKTITIRQQNKEYIHTGIATDDQILPLINALKLVAKERYTNGRHQKFDDVALTIYQDGATPEQVEAFGEWWKQACWYDPPTKAALLTIADEWSKFRRSVNKQGKPLTADDFEIIENEKGELVAKRIP